MDYVPFVIITFFFLFFLCVYLYSAVAKAPIIPSIQENEANKEETFNPSMIPADKLQVFQGNMLPVTPPSTLQLDKTDPSAPSIDGSPSSDTSMFMMAFNKCDPSCCPSPYSCDRGCVCMTKDQINYVAGRGSNNRTPRCTGVSEI